MNKPTDRTRQCQKCDWKGLESETGFGHDDFYCPNCRVESLIQLDYKKLMEQEREDNKQAYRCSQYK